MPFTEVERAGACVSESSCYQGEREKNQLTRKAPILHARLGLLSIEYGQVSVTIFFMLGVNPVL